VNCPNRWLWMSLILIPALCSYSRGARLVEEGGGATRLVAPLNQPSPRPSKKPLLPSDRITLNFDNADLRAVIKFVSEITGRNFLVDEKVKGTVTIFSPTPITVKEVYRVFLSVLEMKGYTVVESGRITKIVPSSEARHRDVLTLKGPHLEEVGREDRVITQIIPLNFADASALKTMLTPLVSKQSHITAYAPTNTLIITDYASNIRRLLSIIRDMDVEGSEEKITVIPLKYASAQTLASELLSLVEMKGPQRVVRRPPRGRPTAGQATSAIQVSKLIADERTNSLILVANRSVTEKLLSLVRKLDQPLPPGRSRIHVYYLENAKAEDLVQVLTQLPIKASAAKPAGGKGPAGAAAPVLGADVQILADKPTNSLIILASPQDYETLKAVIQKLDIVRSQVLVEALIAEVSLTKTKELGVEWQFIQEPRGGVGTFGGANVSNLPSGAPVTPDTLGNMLRAGSLVLGVFKGPITIAGEEFLDFSALIRALQTQSDVNILSTPHILTLDNEEAEIVVAENRPFLKSQTGTAESTQTTTTGATTAVLQTFEFKDIGITLRITPQISKGNFVRLNIFQEVSNVLEIDERTGSPVTAKRQAKTTVMVKDGQTVVIGGLVTDDRRRSQSGVPCLANIPLLGNLFRTRTVGPDTKRNLLIFITPHILHSPAELARITEEKRKERERHRQEYEQWKSRDFEETLDLLLK